MYIDVHCHLDLCKDIEEVIEHARKAGIGVIIANGVDFETNRKILELSRKFNILKAALGIYPIDALKMSDKGINEEIDFIRKNKENIVAIGEVGLDFKESNERKKQKETFLKFINLAKELNKPIIVHSRKAEDDCVEILETAMMKKVIMHCFSGKLKLVKRIAENAWFLSVPGIVSYSSQFQQIVKETPIENLLCETDAPYLHPLREQNNEPANVIFSYKTIAQIKGLDLKEVENKIEKNYKRLFY